MPHSSNSYHKKLENDDNSIIDVNAENLDLSVEKNLVIDEKQFEPPHWRHTYVYSYDEIRNATQEQKQFYSYFKAKILNGEYVDIQGNTNYAFILYFDLLEEYKDHRNQNILDDQLLLLGKTCPKTLRYSKQYMSKEAKERITENFADFNYSKYEYDNYNPDLYKLGNQYKEKLGLEKQEIQWLNKFYNPTNVFLSIEGCCIATIMQYVTILKELDKRLKKNETSLTKEVHYFKRKLKDIYTKRNSEWNQYGYDTSYLSNQAESEVYLTMFKRVENSVRESYGHKRKVSGDFPSTDKYLTEEFENRIGIYLKELIGLFQANIGKPDIETEIELNAQNVKRWQIELNELKASFKKQEKEKFFVGITHLEETNQKNPNIENIFFEASKFIAKFDKVQALIYYAKSISYDLKSKKFDNRKLTKTVQKSLFKTEDQLNDFKDIISELIITEDIQTAIEKISKIYVPKRRKIKLDATEINEVEQKHEGTIDLLNEYLDSDIEDNERLIDEDIKIEIISKTENHSILKTEINLGNAQEELVRRIVTNAFVIKQDEVDKFAAENGMFKNQLIDSINDACQEFLDGEALIEEDEENYIIEKSYYQEIAN